MKKKDMLKLLAIIDPDVAAVAGCFNEKQLKDALFHGARYLKLRLILSGFTVVDAVTTAMETNNDPS